MPAVSGDRHWTRQHPDRVRRGRLHPRADRKLDYARILAEYLHSEREGVRKLAARLGISRTALQRIINGEHWIQRPRSGADGRWFISPHAIQRYIGRIRPGISEEQALCELVEQSKRAHFVKNITDAAGATLQLWRGPKPLRLRYRVARATVPGEKPALVTVLPECDQRDE